MICHVDVSGSVNLGGRSVW